MPRSWSHGPSVPLGLQRAGEADHTPPRREIFGARAHRRLLLSDGHSPLVLLVASSTWLHLVLGGPVQSLPTETAGSVQLPMDRTLFPAGSGFTQVPRGARPG